MNPEEVVLLIADEYSRMSEVYDRVVTPRFEGIALRVLERADPKPNEAVLDLGTGTGLLACLVAPRVAPQGVVAIDLADGALAVGTYRAARLGIKAIRFEMMDVRNIVYRGGAFDAVVSNLGIPSYGTDRCFAEVARVLRPGGRFVFAEWGDFADPPSDAFLRSLEKHRNPDPPKGLREKREAFDFWWAAPWTKELRDPQVVRRRLEKAGFRDVDVRTELVKAEFPSPDAYLEFRLAWGRYEAEASGMTPEARAAFLDEVRRELRAIAGGERLTADWLLHFYSARVG